MKHIIQLIQNLTITGRQILNDLMVNIMFLEPFIHLVLGPIHLVGFFWGLLYGQILDDTFHAISGVEVVLAKAWAF